MPTDETTRPRLLAALADEIAREGYGNAKVQEVARAAQVSLRTYYASFPSKEAGFLELQAVLYDGLAASIEAAVDFDQPWRDAIRGGFTTYFQILRARPRLTAAIVHELTTMSPEGAAARELWRVRFSTMLCDLVDEGRRHFPEVPSRPLSPLAARGILGAILELVSTEVVGDPSPDDGGGPAPGEERASFDDLVETGTDLLWSLITNVDR